MTVRYLSTSSAAEALDLGRNTIWKLIRAGKLRAVNIAPAGARPRYRISEDDLRHYIESHDTAEVDEPAPIEASA